MFTKKEIKFRVWAPDEKRMIKNAVVSGDIVIAEYDLLTEDTDFEPMYYSYENSKSKTPFVVMQFTGIRDMVGKEVYESDKVIYTLSHDSSQKENEAVVEWHKHAWRLNKIWLLTEIRNIKVVGNIHENAGLLVVAP